MALFYGTEYTKVLSSKGTRLTPKDFGGSIRVAYGSFTNPSSGGAANGDSVVVFALPAGARILGGELVYTAQGTSVTLAVGVSGTTNKYLAATAAASAGKTQDVAMTIATYYGEQLSAATEILVTYGGANPSANAQFALSMYYVVD